MVLDPKGEIVRDTGNLLREKGYEVRVLDLINMQKSHCYNPFVYIDSDNDVQRLVTNLFKSTTPKGSQSNDPFWDTAASMLLMSLIFYLHYEAPPEEQNFSMVMEMLRNGDVDEEHEKTPSVLDELFAGLEAVNPGHIALKYYHAYRSGAAKTLKSIQITLASRLEKFNLDSLASLTATDELDLKSLGEKKVALFALIPDNDTSFNFLVSILYTQLFQQLFGVADHKYGGALPVPVHFLMDEFLDNKYAIVFIRGEKPVLDLKYDLLSHPSIKLGADGGAEPYDHGKVEHEGLGIEIVDIADYPGMTIEDFPKIDEYFADMVSINGGLKAIGYALLVLFFLMGIMRHYNSMQEVKRPEQALKLFIRFALAKAAVTWGLDLMLALFRIVQGIIGKIISASGIAGNGATYLPSSMIKTISG